MIFVARVKFIKVNKIATYIPVRLIFNSRIIYINLWRVNHKTVVDIGENRWRTIYQCGNGNFQNWKVSTSIHSAVIDRIPLYLMRKHCCREIEDERTVVRRSSNLPVIPCHASGMLVVNDRQPAFHYYFCDDSSSKPIATSNWYLMVMLDEDELLLRTR